VLGREERGHPRAPHVAQQRDGVLQPPVDRRLMGEKTEATPAQELQLVVEENVEAARDGGHARV
jgi:hypothetical protein